MGRLQLRITSPRPSSTPEPAVTLRPAQPGGDGHCGGRMPKLFLVGITPDHRGLVLSEHARAKRGDMVLEIDDRLIDAIEKANRLRRHDEGQQLESAALPTKREDVNSDAGPPRLSPRE